MSLIAELKRRNVIRVAVAYAVMGWLLTEVSSVVLPTFSAPDWVMKVLIYVLMLGFIPAVVFSWVYELTPEGVKRESEVDRASSVTGDTGRRLDFISLAALAVVAAFVFFQRGTPLESPGSDPISTGNSALAPSVEFN